MIEEAEIQIFLGGEPEALKPLTLLLITVLLHSDRRVPSFEKSDDPMTVDEGDDESQSLKWILLGMVYFAYMAHKALKAGKDGHLAKLLAQNSDD